LITILILCGGGYFLLSETYFADVYTAQKRDSKVIGPLDKGHNYSQSFVSNKPYLSRIELAFLSSGYAYLDNFQITIHLQDQTHSDLAVARYDIPRFAQIFNIRFSFKPQRHSLNQKYYLLIQTDAPQNIVFLLGSEYNVYREGELFSNGKPTDYDLAFFTYSKPPPFLLLEETIRKSSLRYADILLIGLGFFGLGHLVTSIFLTSDDIVERFGYALVLGVAVPPIILFSLSLFAIKLTKINIGLVLAGLLFLAIALRFVRSKGKATSLWALVFKLQKSREAFVGFRSGETIAIGAVFVFVLLTRVIQINDLIVPSGVGGLAHQRILDKIVEKGEIPVDSIYHMGFHSNVLLVNVVTDLSLPEATLLFGQWLSAASGLSFYLLARKILKDPLLASISAALYWFVAPIPAYMINWSRYPFLQGMTLMPVAFSSFANDHEFLRSNKAILVMLLVGLLLSHYGVFLLTMTSLLTVFLRKVCVKRPNQFQVKAILSIVIISLPPLLIIAIKSYIIATQGPWNSFIQQGAVAMTWEDYEYIFGHTLRHGGGMIWLLGILGFALLLLHNFELLPLTIIWGFSLLGLNWLQVKVTSHTVLGFANILYFLAIPLPILGGLALKFILNNNRWLSFLMLAMIVLVGGYNISGIVNPRNVFFSSVDRAAMQWIEMNTRPDSIFLISSYPYDGNYKPEDGGGWITYLTGRETAFLQNESEYKNIAYFIDQMEVDYIYIGSGYGDLATFVVSNPKYNLVYAQNGILIYEVPH